MIEVDMQWSLSESSFARQRCRDAKLQRRGTNDNGMIHPPAAHHCCIDGEVAKVGTNIKHQAGAAVGALAAVLQGKVEDLAKHRHMETVLWRWYQSVSSPSVRVLPREQAQASLILKRMAC